MGGLSLRTRRKSAHQEEPGEHAKTRPFEHHENPPLVSQGQLALRNSPPVPLSKQKACEIALLSLRVKETVSLALLVRVKISPLRPRNDWSITQLIILASPLLINIVFSRGRVDSVRVKSFAAKGMELIRDSVVPASPNRAVGFERTSVSVPRDLSSVRANLKINF